MPADLRPEDILKSLEKGDLAPFYLFYGPGEFRLERVLSKIREELLPESARDFNLEISYGGESDPYEIINHAKTSPFMAQNRLIIVRRTEEYRADQLDKFIPYLENPAPSTCLIFISSKTDFKRKFYKKIRSSGFAVNFLELRNNQVVPWIRRIAGELNMNISEKACNYLQQIVGNRLRDLYSELIKLQLRYGEVNIGEEQIKELVIHGRIYSIFELMNAISAKDGVESLSVLNRFLEEEDKRSAPLQIIGMLNRQISLLWQTKGILKRGGKPGGVAGKLGIPPFSAGDFIKQSKAWTENELEKGISLLNRADQLIKAGSRPRPVLESLIIALCA